MCDPTVTASYGRRFDLWELPQNASDLRRWNTDQEPTSTDNLKIAPSNHGAKLIGTPSRHRTFDIPKIEQRMFPWVRCVFYPIVCAHADTALPASVGRLFQLVGAGPFRSTTPMTRHSESGSPQPNAPIILAPSGQ